MISKKTIILISIISVVVILALTLGLVFGLRKKGNNDDDVEIVNSYDNTEELIKKFPVANTVTVREGLEKKIQNRLLTGFENWNRGFKAWKKWGNILYTNESIYNVHGCRLTLEHYQQAMDISLQQADIIMGDFHNMLITDNFCGIHYDFITAGTKSRVMEFVRFKEYGEPLGARVSEGWGSTKDTSYEGLKNFQGDDESRVQEEQIFFVVNYQIPSNETDLKKKYPIKYKTEYIDKNADEILNIILEGFDKWNTGIEDYEDWVKNYYDSNAISSSLEGKDRTRDEYIKEMEELCDSYEIKKKYFDNILIRGNWAALHYRYTREKKPLTGEDIYAGDRMQFLKFEEKDGSLKIVNSWIQ
jgi:hypothetical protein